MSKTIRDDHLIVSDYETACGWIKGGVFSIQKVPCIFVWGVEAYLQPIHHDVCREWRQFRVPMALLHSISPTND